MKNRNDAVVTIEEIREIIDRRSLECQINEGFDVQKNEHFTYIEVFHGDTKLMLDLAGEYTIYLGDWHGHYYSDEIVVKETEITYFNGDKAQLFTKSHDDLWDDIFR